MAEYTTHFFPKDSHFQPTDAAAQAGKAMLEEIYPYQTVQTQQHASKRLITSGADFDRFNCPSCKTIVQQYQLDDAAQQWWYTELCELRDEAQIITVPCCGAEIAVRQIDFGNDVGFAKFQIDVEAAGADEMIDDAELQRLEAILGCALCCVVFVSD